MKSADIEKLLEQNHDKKGEPLHGLFTALKDALARAEKAEARIAELEAKLEAVRGLAERWEEGADARLVPEREAQWLRLCAAELRERAKEGTCE